VPNALVVLMPNLDIEGESGLPAMELEAKSFADPGLLTTSR
jgi:hypothetical protein